jgi:hypothetical protein
MCGAYLPQLGRSENLGFFGMKTALRRSSFAAQAAQAQPLTWDRPEIRLSMGQKMCLPREPVRQNFGKRP